VPEPPFRKTGIEQPYSTFPQLQAFHIRDKGQNERPLFSGTDTIFSMTNRPAAKLIFGK
jgi:hypothetical protein